MASIQISPLQSSLNPDPEFSFLPKYAYSRTIDELVAPRSALLPKSGLSSYSEISRMRIPQPGPALLPEIMTPITPLSPLPPRSTLLTIPLELRLQIYHYVLLSHPIRHAHLAPFEEAAKNEEFHTSMRRSQDFSSSSLTQQTSQSGHVQGKIPTALLVSCKQIYTETRDTPFTASRFSYVNWFHSGVYAALQFSRSLSPWQSRAMRSVFVEVLGRDLWDLRVCLLDEINGSTRAYGVKRAQREWRELCSLWDGVRVLRLRIKGSVIWLGEQNVRKENIDPSSDLLKRDFAGERRLKERGIFNVQMQWVLDGLVRMKSLRRIELEIEDEDVDRDVKIGFCAELEGFLSETRNRDDGWTGDVKAIFVERIPEKAKVFHVGEPGDEEIWGGQS